MTFFLPLVGLLASAAIAAVVAFRLRLFAPRSSLPLSPPHRLSLPEPAGSRTGAGGTGGGESALPLLVGAFATYSSWMLIGALVASVTGLAGWTAPPPPAATGGDPTSLPPVEPPLELVARTHLLIGVLTVPVAAAICWWARRAAGRGVGGPPLDRSAKATAKVAGQAVLWCLVVLPMVYVVGIAASEISAALGRPVDRTAHTMLKLIVDRSGDTASRWMLIATAVVVAPMLEELIYRGLLQRAALTLTRSPWVAVLLTSVLFTAVHAGVIPTGSFWPAASLIFSLSVFLGLLMVRTGSVVTSMVVHAAFNAVSIVAAVGGQ